MVAQYQAEQLLTQRDQVSAAVRDSLTKRAQEFNILVRHTQWINRTTFVVALALSQGVSGVCMGVLAAASVGGRCGQVCKQRRLASREGRASSSQYEWPEPRAGTVCCLTLPALCLCAAGGRCGHHTPVLRHRVHKGKLAWLGPAARLHVQLLAGVHPHQQGHRCCHPRLQPVLRLLRLPARQALPTCCMPTKACALCGPAHAAGG